MKKHKKTKIIVKNYLVILIMKMMRIHTNINQQMKKVKNQKK